MNCDNAVRTRFCFLLFMQSAVPRKAHFCCAAAIAGNRRKAADIRDEQGNSRLLFHPVAV